MINLTNKKSKRLYQMEFDRQMMILENSFVKQIRPVLNRQYFSAASMVKQGVMDITKSVNESTDRLINILYKHYIRTAGVFSQKAFGIIENSKSIIVPEIKTPKDEFYRAMNLWMITEAGDKITKINASTKRNINAVIQKGLNDGISHRDIAKNIRKNGLITSRNRALVIARTETHTVAVKAVDESVRSTRIEMEREWVSAKDLRTRTFGKGSSFEHFLSYPAGPDGERVSQDGYFQRTGEPMKFPGDPMGSGGNTIRCRCVLVYHTVKRTESLKPYVPENTYQNPMTSIGNLSNCIRSKKEILSIIELKKKPTGCDDYVRLNGSWMHKGKEIDEKELNRLNAMKLPPNWKNVTASKDPLAKVQAVGQDKAGRWQYRYSEEHIKKAAQRKFDRVKIFSNDMIKIRKGIKDGIKNDDARAYVLSLENQTAIRAGSTTDFKAKTKAYGLTTLQKEHLKIKGNKIILDFVAKEGIPAHYEIEDKVLAKWLNKRRLNLSDGDMLFPDVSAYKLNKYISELAGGKKYTVKDFRTYHGTRIAFHELKGYGGKSLTDKEKNLIVKNVTEKVSDFLHNTPIMAKKSYIDPMVWDFIGGID